MGNSRNLPFQGTDVQLKYNGYNFYETSKCMVQAKPVYQQNEVAVKYIRYSITVHAIVAAGDLVSGDRDPSTFPDDAETTTNMNLRDLRKVLTTPRRELYFKNLGFGDLEVGPLLTLKDVNFGPKPRVLVWEPIGADQAARVIWTVDVDLPECGRVPDADTGYSNVFSEYTYTEAFSHTPEGFLVRRITGYAEIAAAPYASTFSQDIGRFREQFTPAPIHNCKRTENTFVISQDKRSCTFNVVDMQLKSYYELQRGVTSIEASHRLGSNNKNSAGTVGFDWTNTLRVKIKLHAGLTASPDGRRIAWLTFLRILDDRLGEGYRTVNPKNTIPIVRKVDLDHNLTNPEFSFTCSWTLVIGAYDDLFTRTAFFQDGQRVSITAPEWQASVLPGEGQTRSEDMDEGFFGGKNIVTVCNNQKPATVAGIVRFNSRIPQLGTPPTILKPQCPSESQSWVTYRNNVNVKGERQIAVNYTLQEPDGLLEGESLGNARGERAKLDSTHEKGTNSESSNVVAQRMGNSHVQVVMSGFSLKYNSPSTTPELTTFGGKKVILLKEYLNPSVLVEENPCPLYYTKWTKLYQVTDFPEDTELEGQATTNGLDSGTTDSDNPENNQNSLDSRSFTGALKIGGIQ